MIAPIRFRREKLFQTSRHFHFGHVLPQMAYIFNRFEFQIDRFAIGIKVVNFLFSPDRNGLVLRIIKICCPDDMDLNILQITIVGNVPSSTTQIIMSVTL